MHHYLDCAGSSVSLGRRKAAATTEIMTGVVSVSVICQELLFLWRGT